MHSKNSTADLKTRFRQLLDLEVIGYLAVLLASACWATSALFVKLILTSTQVSALALAFWRDVSTFSAFFIGLAVLRPTLLRVSRRDLPWLAAMGGALGIFHVFWNLGVFLNGAAVATVQQAAMPAIVAAAAWAIWREPLTWWKVLAIVLTFVGTVLVSGLGVLGEAEFTLSGFVVGLGIPIGYAAWNLLGKQARGNHAPPTVLVYAFSFAALVLLPFQFFTPQPWPVPPSVLLYLVGLVLVTGVAGFTIYTFALGRLQASIATILAMSEIPFVAIYAFAILGERISALQSVGAVLVVVGVLLLFGQKQNGDTESAPELEG
ncbi:MAG: DMT family transporter [Anaerolineae bacterium]